MVLVEQGHADDGLERLEEARILLRWSAAGESKRFESFIQRYSIVLEGIGRPGRSDKIDN